MTVETEAQDIVDPATTENNSAASQESEELKQQTQEPEVEQTEEEKAKAAEEAEEKKRSRAKERIERLARENAELRKFKEEAEAKAKQPVQSDEAPKIEDFEDYSDYLKAQQDWYIKQAEERVLARLNKDKAEQTQVQRQAEFQAAIVEAATEHPDFDQVIQEGISRQLPMPITLDEVADEFGYDAKTQTRLLYELACDETFHEQVSAATKLKAALLLKERVDSFSKTAPPPTSKAPAPIKPVTANAPASRDPEKMSTDEWMKHRNEQLKNRK
ncbi:hypothetical protein NT90_04165 [Acinetobacter baumannii]|nr:hypothetical protein NT90_04165 [Acinetobacter baumannii]